MHHRLSNSPLILIIFITSFLIGSCKHEPEPFPDETPTGGKPCHPDTVYFQNDILPLLQSSCALSGCHDAITQADGVNLTNYNAVIQTADVRPFNPGGSDLYERITENKPDKIMPPPPKSPLTSEQINLIYTWIMQGALNNACDQYPCDSLNVTFTQTIWPIIQNHCLGCHSGGAPSGGISLNGYADVVNAANSGQLLGTISHTPGYSPMPKNSAKLDNCKISQIKKWINNGTPNN